MATCAEGHNIPENADHCTEGHPAIPQTPRQEPASGATDIQQLIAFMQQQQIMNQQQQNRQMDEMRAMQQENITLRQAIHTS